MNSSENSNKVGMTDAMTALLSEASPEISFLLDSVGTVIDFHGGSTPHTALLPDPYIGRQLPDILPSELADLVCTRLRQAVKDGEAVTIELPLQLKAERLTFEARLIPFSSGRVIAIIRNISRRKRAKEITRLIEERFSTIFRNTSAGMVLGAPDGSLIEVNPAFCHFLGYTMAELLKLTVEEITHPDDREMSRQQRSASLQGHSSTYTYEKRYVRKDGSTVWGQLSSNWFHDADGRPLYAVGLIQDITERKRMEEALRESEERFRRLYNDTPAMLHSIDQNGRLLSASNYWLEVLGYERSEVLGRKSTEFLTEASRRYAEEMVLPEFFKTGICKDVSYQFLTKGGELIEVLLSATADRNDAGEIVRSMAVMTDVTERKRAEEALRESEEKFAKAFRANPSPLAISTLTEGRFIEINEAFERVFGYKDEEAIGRSSRELNMWQYPQDRQRMISILQSEGRVRNEEITFGDKNGKTVIALYSAELIDLRGEPCLLSIVDDITARKQLEEKIEILNTDLACRAFELESANLELENFSHTVSHDLRSPLTSITGYCELLLDYQGDGIDEQSRSYLEQIYSASHRMAHLINALLDFSCLTRGEIQQETVNLSGLAREISVELRLEAPQRSVNFRIAEGITANGDGLLLRAVLQNLLGNSWKYTARKETAEIDFGMTENDGVKVYFVRDNGAGFDMAQADKLFTPFQRLHDKQEFAGSGIGLATVQRIIKRHGGRVWATGEIGKGATFFFTLQ